MGNIRKSLTRSKCSTRFDWSRVSMSLGITSVLYGILCCLSFYLTWSHFRSVWVFMLSECLCHFVSLPFCMGLYVVRVSITLGLTSVTYWSLCCLSLLLFDRTFQENLLPCEVHIPHHNQRRQFAKLLLEKNMHINQRKLYISFDTNTFGRLFGVR